MSSRSRRFGGDRGRHPGGVAGRSSSMGSLEFRRILLTLYNAGYSIQQIINYLLTSRLGPPERPGRPEPEPQPEPEPEPQPEPEPEPQPEPEKVKVKRVDLQVASNTKEHHTEEYDLVDPPNPLLVVRRGQPFTINVHFSSAFNHATHQLRLIFEIGKAPVESKGTRVSCLLSGDIQEGKWGAKLVQKARRSVEVSVSTPPDCIVGQWDLALEVLMDKERTLVSRYDQEKPFYILFNPWCPDDMVYNDSQEALEEYVLNDTGCIFTGNAWWSGPRAWEFGQFSGNVLDCSLDLLDDSDLRTHEHGDPIKVVRKLSAMINIQDDNGVLVGRWDGTYDDGKNPSFWTGSADILEKYHSTKQPVRYGQCWVFSGLLTTACRALGIPCRSITNFASAHDTNMSVTIDEHFDENGEEVEYLNGDSIWNFHVWNEVWMRRDDLPKGYGGWQVCDATPQEASGGVYQCGPCPVRCIKEGNLNLPYDAHFIFAEVNADEVKWMKDGERNEFKPVTVKRNTVGKNMSTRAMGPHGNEREVITHLYKHEEGSPEERAAVWNAYGHTTPRWSAYDLGPQDVEFKLRYPVDRMVGQDFVVALECRNKSGKVRTISGLGVIRTMFYTGIPADKVAVKNYQNIKLSPGAVDTVVEMTVTPEEYRRQLKDGCSLHITMTSKVEETKQAAVEADITTLVKPSLTIQGSDKGRVAQEFDVTVSFINPLPYTLTDCQLNVEGSGITKPVTYPQPDVPAQGTFSATLKLKPKKKGRRHVVFVFNSKELNDINGRHDLLVSA